MSSLAADLAKLPPLDARGFQRKYDAFADDFQAKVATLAGQVADGSISPAQFRTRMTNLIRVSYTDAYRLGASVADDSHAVLSDEDRVVLGRYLHDEIQHLDDFVRFIKEGDISEAWIEARAKLYGKAIHGIYWEARLQHADANYDAYYELGANEKHCVDCLAASAGSPYAPSRCPRPGAETCLGLDNCRCSVRLVRKPGADSSDQEVRA